MVNDVFFSQANTINCAHFWMSDGWHQLLVMTFFKISNNLYLQTTSKSFRIFELNGAILLTLIFLFELLKYYLLKFITKIKCHPDWLRGVFE